LFLKARLRREWADDSADAMARTRLLWRYLKLYLFRWRQEDKEFVRSTELSHRVVFANEGARRNFVRCLILHGRGDLSERLAVVPYPVDVAFLDQSPDRRCPRAIAVGRWNDAQKNSGLLARSIEGYYRDGGDWEIQVVGGGGESAFLKLATQYPLFRILGKLPPSEIAKLLASSRVLLCTSRWESGPIVAFEALASGCTIVTTPLPSIISFLENGRGGRSSASHKPPDFLTSMREEFSAWDHGLRSTADLSSQWRSQLRFQRICAELVQGF
jgi:glycosyltransferase involved in cell wall biosynthesis